MWGPLETRECFDLASRLVSNKGCESNPEGLSKNRHLICELLRKYQFEIEEITNPKAPYRPVIIAKRILQGNERTVGFFGHYDVEEANPKEWDYSPWKLLEIGGRWYGRGVADNLVPLVHRIMISDYLAKHCNLVYVLQGEEEIGSPFAMETYSELELGSIDIWVEETGYFYKNGNHRIMYVNNNAILDNVIEEVSKVNQNHGIETKIRERPMNKAFGNQGCPCLVHLLKEIPYIALGPNDDYCTIHGVNETINPNYLGIASKQLICAVEAVSNA